MSPDVYELTNGTISIKYYNGDCCCIAEKVLTEIKSRIERKKINAQKFADKYFTSCYLQSICDSLKQKEGEVK